MRSRNFSTDKNGFVSTGYRLKISKGSILFYFFFICFLVSYVWQVSGKDNILSFTTLLETFASCPTVPTDWIYSFTSRSVTADWGAFNFLRDFVNSFCIPFCGIFLQFWVSISQIFVYVVWIGGLLFGGAPNG